MKRLIWGLLPVLIAFPLRAGSVSGGFGGFEFGSISYDAGDLNERFGNAGIEEIKDMVYTWGGRGYGIISNVLIGGSGRGGKIRTESDSVTLNIDIGYGLFEVGYILPLGGKLAFCPTVGIGGKSISLSARPDLGDVNFDDLLIPAGAGRTSRVSTSGTIISLSLAGLFRLGSFIDLFARAGYSYDFGGDWKIEDGAMLKDAPDFKLSGTSFSAGIMFGFWGVTDKGD